MLSKGLFLILVSVIHNTGASGGYLLFNKQNRRRSSSL